MIMLTRKNLGVIVVVSILVISGAIFFRQWGGPSTTGDEKLQVLTSFYPLGYMAEVIGGDKIEVSILIPPGGEVHSWQPSISDIAGAEEADLIIFNGAGLDHWMEEDIIRSIDPESKIIVQVSEDMDLIEMHEEDHAEEGEHEHGEGDPHIWVSPHTALIIANKIFMGLVEADPSNEDYYRGNWESFDEILSSLDEEYSSTLSSATRRKFFVTHSAYGYVAENYGLEQHGIIGLSADEQPSTSKISQMVEEMTDEENYVIYVDPVYSDEYARTLKDELESRTGETVKILNLYLMVGPADDLDYVEQLEANLENLAEGLTG
jgi:zinc transport system substrate-binding protein